MRDITIIMADALLNGKNKKLSNTIVKDGEMFLHGNKIAKIEGNRIYFCMCGWNTVTIRERLSGLGIRICQRKFKPYWNDKEIDANKVYSMAIEKAV